MELTTAMIKKASDHQIDRWIGEHIFGWVLSRWADGRYVWTLKNGTFCSFSPSESHGFSRRMAEAWAVVQWFLPIALKVELTAKETQYSCYIDCFPNEYEAHSSTPERAICEAALMARKELINDNACLG